MAAIPSGRFGGSRPADETAPVTSGTKPALSLDFWTMEFKKPNPLPPTLTNVPCGADPNQVLDFWKADSKQPTPLVFFIHGGAWKSNDKNRVTGLSNLLSPTIFDFAGLGLFGIAEATVGV